MDRIHIRDLLLRADIGVFEWEHGKPQDVVLNITLHADLSQAMASDQLDDTVDYKGLKQSIITLVDSKRFALVERLASEVADLCLLDARVRQVDVIVDKPGALRYARSVAVEISREQRQ